MAVNQYTQPAQAQFINTYVPIPFNEIVQAGMAKQQAYNQGSMAFDQLQANANQLNYIPNSEDENYIRNVVLPTFDTLHDEFASQDYGDPVVIRDLYKKLNTSIDKQRINRIQQNATAYGKWNEQLQKMGIDNKLAPYLNQFDPTRFDSRYQMFNLTPEAAVDYDKAAEQYFDDVDKQYLGTTPVDPANDIYGIVHGVHDSKIQQLAKDNLASFMGTAAGRQYGDYLRHLGVDEKDIPQSTLSFLYNKGKEKLSSQVTTYKGNGEDNGKDGHNDFTESENTQFVNNQNLLPVDEFKKQYGFDPTKVTQSTDLLKKFNFDKSGNIVPKSAENESFNYLYGDYVDEIRKGKIKDLYYEPRTFWKNEKVIDMKTGEEHKISKEELMNFKRGNKQKEYNKEYSDIRNKVDNIKSYILGDENLTDMQALLLYSNAYNDAKDIAHSEFFYDSKEQKDMTSMISRDLGGRDIQVGETGKRGGTSLNTIGDFYSKYDIPEKNQKPQINGVAPSIGKYTASVIDKEGNVRDFNVSFNDREQYTSQLVRNATTAAQQGVIGEKEITAQGKKYVLTTVINPETGKFEYNVRVPDNSNDYITINGVKLINPKTKEGLKQAPLSLIEQYTVELLKK